MSAFYAPLYSELVFIGSAHVFSANLYAELRQKHLKYDSIPACFFLVSIQIMLENTYTPPMNTSSQISDFNKQTAYGSKPDSF